MVLKYYSDPAEPMPPIRRQYLILFLCIILPLITIDRDAVQPDPWEGAGGLRRLIYTLQEIKLRAAKYPGDAVLYQAAARAMVNAVDDRYTTFLQESDYRQMNDHIEDVPVGGIGGIFSIEDGKGMRLDAVIPGGSAEKEGMRPGDVITHVDGQPLVGITPEEMQAKLLGTANSIVTISYERGNRTITTSLKRTAFPTRTVSVSEILEGEPRVGYVHLQMFSREAPSLLTDAIDELLEQGAEGLILDVRGNEGGYMEAGLAVADMFLSSGIITTLERGDGQGHWIPPTRNRRGIQRARPGSPLEDIPMVVLVDGGTASAAELVAGALRDNGRAVLIGTKTYGKARMQEIISLDDNGGTRAGGLRMTVARFLTPKGEDFDQKGLMPDIPVVLGTSRRDSALAERYLRDNLTSRWLGLEPPIPDDPVIETGIAHVRKLLSGASESEEHAPKTEEDASKVEE